MIIQKIFSDEYNCDRLYSVILGEREYNFLNEIQREFAYTGTKYDMTDQYKQMKDSDILAEKKKSNAGTYVSAMKTGLTGAGIGAGAALLTNGVRAGKTGSGFFGKLGAARGGFTKKAALTGATLGAIGGLGVGLINTHKKREENRFANDRLQRAKYQAERRERRDWKNNITNREGYTY